MIELYDDKIKCTGCYACYNICPKACIEMKPDKEGFVYPNINHDECIECGLCKKVCPIEKENTTDNEETPKYVTAIIKDEYALKQSSSGGVFSVLSRKILSENGVVYGCGLDENIVAKHMRIDDEKNLYKLRGSKYVQSDVSFIYKNVKQDLDANKRVLFSGTPCQIAGVQSYLQKTYDNLYLVEVLCHGVPSPKLFKQHIDRLKAKHKGEIKNYEMRSKKRFSWGSENRTHYEVFKHGKTKKYNPLFPEYFTAFFYGISLRPSCYSCKYSTPKRWADLTLADFWGYYRTYKKHFTQGISVVSINNEKGQQFMDSVVYQMAELDEVTFEQATNSNIHFRFPMQKMAQRDSFYKEIEKKGYNEIYKQVYFKFKKKKKLVQTFYGRFVPGVVRRKITDIKQKLK